MPGSAWWSRGPRPALAPDASVLAARVSPGGECTPVHQVAAAAARPLASMFKLFVLGALAHQVAITGPIGPNAGVAKGVRKCVTALSTREEGTRAGSTTSCSASLIWAFEVNRDRVSVRLPDVSASRMFLATVGDSCRVLARARSLRKVERMPCGSDAAWCRTPGVGMVGLPNGQ